MKFRVFYELDTSTTMELLGYDSDSENETEMKDGISDDK